MKGITVLEARNFLRILERQNERIKKLEGLLQGQGVSSVKITDLSADKINTGILVVKDGTDNAKILVKNGGGDTIVTLDVSGITVDDGNIVVRNGDGDIVFDTAGLVSLFAFDGDTVEKDADQTIDGDDGWVDVIDLTLDFTLSRETKVLFTAAMAMEHEEFDQPLFSRFVLDGTPIGPVFLGGMDFLLGTFGNTFVHDVAAGSHTIKIQSNAFIGGTNGFVRGTNAGSCNLSYLLLGT